MPARGIDLSQEYEMTRGIHLKQLTQADLDLLGLAEDRLPATPDPAPSTGNPAPDAGSTAARRPVGPPSNPVVTAGSADAADSDGDWPPFDLAAVARDLCRELEVTLRLLDGTGGETAQPD